MRLNIINLINNFNDFNNYLFTRLNSIGNINKPINFSNCQDVFNKCQNYLIFEQQPIGSIKLFNYLVNQRSNGLVITRTHPDKLTNSLGLNKLNNIDMYWLSTEDFDYVIRPWETRLLINTLQNFIEKERNGVILLNGLEYMSTYNNSNRILNIIFNIIDIVGTTEAKILFTLDPLALDNNFFFNIQNNSEISLIPTYPLKEVLD